MTGRVARAWLAHEVVQTSSMDCGPAALKCLLAGYGIPAHYGRLREACQTSIDGTSIDTLEQVAGCLGLQTEQVLVPADHLALPEGAALPALAVVHHADLGAHFVVVWRRLGGWVQLMDPAGGRRWARLEALRRQLYRHEMPVPAADWRAHAAGAGHLAALRARLRALGLGDAALRQRIDAALADPGWQALAALDAAARLAQALVDAGGLRRGADAARLTAALCSSADAQRSVPADCWSVQPVPGDPERLMLRGCVLLLVRGRAAPQPAASSPMAGELDAVLRDRAEPVSQVVWRCLREDDRALPLALLLGAAVAGALTMLELLLLRGVFDLALPLQGGGQRAAAVALLAVFLLVGLLLQWPLARESMRLGRHLELRLRALLLQRLPRLVDRYFTSRPVSDLADRAHGLHLARALPGSVLDLWQTLLQLAFTLAGLLWLAPQAWLPACALAAFTLAVPLAAWPLLAGRELRVRTHAAALAGFYLDALLGLVPVKAHRAERALRREQESLLTAWAQSLAGLVRAGLWARAAQGALGLAWAVLFLATHFRAGAAVSGADLLLVFWALRLPALGSRLAALAQQLPAQRNALARLLEPLGAPATPAAGPAPALPAAGAGAGAGQGALALQIEDGQVCAGGHTLLADVQLQIAAGEHVAVVGASGAGKSSLLGLLLGWHALAAGRLLLDGQPLAGPAEAELAALRARTAWVDPAVQLWNQSLMDNLQYGCADADAALGRLGPVTARAQLRDVAARLPQGLQTLLGEGGGLLSGGEGQRVRLGRALLQDAPRLVLLDEPFRGLDRGQRAALLRESRQWWQASTLLCVTHDVGETRAFPRVIVVEEGRIVADGAPAALAGQPGPYRDLLDAERQLQSQVWAAAGWRRLALAGGRVAEGAAP